MPDQLTVCGDKVEGAHCDGDGFTGICTANHLCLPGCGDGSVNGVEECDDKNFRSHDGCSSTCLVERPIWEAYQSPWQPRNLAAIASGVNRSVMFGGATALGLDDNTWIFSGTSWQHVATTMARPTPRQAAGLAYDSNRGVFVLFGGSDNTQVLGDTWEFTVGAHEWTKVTPTASPPARAFMGMAYDPVRARVVMFGGLDSSDQALADTWEYDGTTWTLRTPSTPPPALYEHAMAYDPARSAVVLFGGLDASGTRQQETWELAAGQWTHVAAANPPSKRNRTALVFNPLANKLLLFGGSSDPTGSPSGDTWTYDGNWNQVATTVSPGGRSEHMLGVTDDGVVLMGGHASSLLDDSWFYNNAGWQSLEINFDPSDRTSPLAYDEEHHFVVLAGGLPSGIRDTWAFDVAWHNQPAILPKPIATGHTLAYDATNKYTVAVGGRGDRAGTESSATYTYDGAATWTLLATQGQPPARWLASMAFGDGTGVLFGGAQGATDLGDTWELTGSTWTAGPTSGPPPQTRSPLVYDALGKRTILFDEQGDTWSYASHAWTKLAGMSPAPAARRGASLVYDPFRQKVQLLGGTDGTTFFTDFWELDGDTWHQIDIAGSLPPRRDQFEAVYAKSLAAIVMFGAATPVVLGDTWFLRFYSPTPDEICGDGLDNDGDKFVDHDDDDCMMTP